MKKLRFAGKEVKSFANAVRKNVNQYFQEKGISQKGNWKMIFKSVFLPGLYLAPFIVLLTVGMPWWFILWMSVIMGFGLATTGMAVMHDAVHGSFSDKPWLNKLMGNTMYLLGGSKFTWKVQHNYLHHSFTNIEGADEDLDGPFILRLSPNKERKWIHRFQHVYASLLYCFMTLSKIIFDFFQLGNYNKRGLTKNQGGNPTSEYTKMVAFKSVYFFIVFGLPLLFSDFTFWQILLGFLIMHMTAGFILSVIFQLAHVVEAAEYPVPDEKDELKSEWAVHQLKTTADFGRKNRFLTFFIGGLNFQVEHHLFPNICHIHYRKISEIVEKTAKEFNVPYHGSSSFGSAIASHYRLLKRLGRA
jgi:linoleoyl-CoA desaturase